MIERKPFIAALLSLAAIAEMVCGQETIPGPESDALLPVVSGYVLVDRAGREITAIELPSLKETVIKPKRPNTPDDDPTIHALSGPDSEGRIAFIEDHYFVADENQRHLLKTIRIDGTEETVLFLRPGDAMWAASAAGNGEIGEGLALAPNGGRIAFLSAVEGVQMPGALLQEGTVEVWDVEKKTGAKLHIRSVDEGFAWFPDGKHLAYTKLVDPGEIPKSDDSFGQGFLEWPKIPTVYILDVDTGHETFLHVGCWRPVVALDGKTVLVCNHAYKWTRVDVSTKQAVDVTWSGIESYRAIALPSGDLVLSWCLPTSGAKVKYTENNSPLRGPKLMLSLKLARIGTGEFQTVVPYVDPRNEVSFGQMSSQTTSDD